MIASHKDRAISFTGIVRTFSVHRDPLDLRSTFQTHPMKLRSAVVLSTLGLSAAAFAQIGVLTADEMLPVGSEYIMRNTLAVTSLDTSSGMGLTWNNSHLVATGADQEVAILAPGSTPYGSSFPTATYCIYESVVSRYSYYDLNEESMARIGFYRDGLGTYSDPQVEMVFPLTVGSYNFDDWANNTVSFPGTFSYTVLGSGTLQLAAGDFEDALLMRVDVENLFLFRQYAWVSARNGAFLLIYNAPSIFGAASCLMNTTLNVGLEEAGAAIELRVHAASGDVLPVTYSSPENTTYRVLDMAGRTLATGQLPASVEARTEMLDVAALRAGIHLLELSNAQDRSVVRFFMD